MTPERWQRLRSLFDQAVEAPPDARTALLEAACATDPELRRELEALLRADVRAGAPLLDPPATRAAAAQVPAEPGPEALVGRRLGAYELVGLIGQGGMGAVYRAVRADDQFQKQVAVKLLRGSFAGADARRRFQAERQILATLEHPYIARLLDAGTSPEGSPYFVMELVEGLPIVRHCREARLDVRARLRLFLKVCEAVAYAHRALVVHRDLKPANILVTTDGTPRLLDFGVAKLLEPDTGAAPTATALAPMTPEYASPEQVKGERITTASDVYSLGVLLYELLAGTRPYAFESQKPEELLRVVASVQPLAPSERVATRELRRVLRGDLDNIALVALRKEPERRYGSVELLALDVERHLSGRPVHARPDTFLYRGGKFVRRNPLGTALLLLLVGWVLTASYQAHVARRERARAERRLLDVRRLANTLLFELHDAVRELPGSTHARELLVKRALEYLDGLREDAGGDAALLVDLGQAYARIGEIQYRIGSASLGDSPGALKSYARAAELLAPACAPEPREPEACRVLAQVYWLEGNLLKERIDLAGALARYAEARRLDEQLLAGDPGNHKLQRALVDVLRQTARALQQQGRQDQALSHQREALRRAEALQPPLEPADRRSQSLATSDLGEALGQAGDLTGALAMFERSLAIDRQRRAEEPHSTGARRAVGLQLLRRGAVLAQLGKLEAALEDFRGFQQVVREQGAADPANAGARDDLASAGTHICEVLLGLGRLDEAAVECLVPLRIWSAEHAAHPSVDWVSGIATGEYWVGALEARRGNLAAARGHFEESLRRLAALAEPESSSDMQGRVAGGEVALAEVDARAGRRLEALRRYARAYELARPGGQDPDDLESRLSLADVQRAVAELKGHGPEACAAATEAARLYRLAASAHPLPPPGQASLDALLRRHRGCFS